MQPAAQGVILDLRTNGGGLLTQAIAVSDQFLEEGRVIVEIRGRGNRLMQPPYVSDANVSLNPQIPLVVLVDRFTASASEIVASSLQDNGRAVVIGERTYGKGTVQDLIPLERGRSSMKITTATYWRPSGRNINRPIDDDQRDDWGVQPDPGMRVDLSEAEFFQVVTLRNRRQYQTLDIFDRAALPPQQDGENGAPDERRLTEDPVLQRAIEFLQATLERQHSL